MNWAEDVAEAALLVAGVWIAVVLVTDLLERWRKS